MGYESINIILNNSFDREVTFNNWGTLMIVVQRYQIPEHMMHINIYKKNGDKIDLVQYLT